MPQLRLAPVALILLAAALAPAAAHASVQRNAKLAKAPDLPHADYPGIQHLHYRYGPIAITPGQNTIRFKVTDLKPKVPGYIPPFRPKVTSPNGKVPRGAALHLPHGVSNDNPAWRII